MSPKYLPVVRKAPIVRCHVATKCTVTYKHNVRACKQVLPIPSPHPTPLALFLFLVSFFPTLHSRKVWESCCCLDFVCV